MKEISNKVKTGFFKKVFIKICRIFHGKPDSFKREFDPQY